MNQTDQVIQDIKKELWRLQAVKQAEELSGQYYSSGKRKVSFAPRSSVGTFDSIPTNYTAEYPIGPLGRTDWSKVMSLADRIKELEDKLFLLQHPEVVEERARFAELERKSVERAAQRNMKQMTLMGS